jgi:4-hydroxy-3-methylbut-2-enyl diphosphate reductase
MNRLNDDENTRAGGRRRAGQGVHPTEGRVARAGPLTIIVGREAGYCFGVERALRLAGEATATHPAPVSTLGPIIHNPAVVEQLAQRGIGSVESIEAATPGGTIVVRSHGVPPQVIGEARKRGFTVVNATCPRVTVAQRRVAELSEAGYRIIILGEHEHPEVVALAACAGPGAIIVEDPKALRAGAVRNKRVGIVVQTTQASASLAELVRLVAPLARETIVHNTICEATERRQQAARELAAEVDVVLVLGGRNSANTRRLAQLCREVQPRTYHLERAADLGAEMIEGAARVGITTGASTPDEEIDAAIDALRRLVQG